MPLSLPSRPSLDQLRKQAKDLLAAWRAGDAEALSWLREHHPEHSQTATVDELRLADAQLVTARRYGFPSWPRLKTEVEMMGLAFTERARRFVRAAADPFSGTDDPFRMAKRLLEREPSLARADVYTALVLGDAGTVRRQVERDPEWARRKGGPYEDREPLCYVTYSKFHRDNPEIAKGLLEIARLLLDHGADPDAAFVVEPWTDSPLRPLYGACGLANFPAMAELLLDRGATINDFESLYHAQEHPDTRCLELLLARGADPKGTNALNHAMDFPGLERVRLLLEHGADPNEGIHFTPLHFAILRGRERAVLELLVEHGADINARAFGRTPYQVALQLGHAEAAEYLASLGAETGAATPFERFAEACGRVDLESARRVATENPGLFESLSNHEREVFAHIAQLGKAGMIATMIDAGLPVQTAGLKRQTALHWASWHGWRETVEALLARRAKVDAVEDEHGGTPLDWAIHGSDNSPNPQGDYPGVVRLLLDAGADATILNRWQEGSVADVRDPAVADLLRAAGAKDREE
ncbi:MAG TPA: ankyrin repeat domain-containing protein [Thermoanaerobaculia bacterium]